MGCDIWEKWVGGRKKIPGMRFTTERDKCSKRTKGSKSSIWSWVPLGAAEEMRKSSSLIVPFSKMRWRPASAYAPPSASSRPPPSARAPTGAEESISWWLPAASGEERERRLEGASERRCGGEGGEGGSCEGAGGGDGSGDGGGDGGGDGSGDCSGGDGESVGEGEGGGDGGGGDGGGGGVDGEGGGSEGIGEGEGGENVWWICGCCVVPRLQTSSNGICLSLHMPPPASPPPPAGLPAEGRLVASSCFCSTSGSGNPRGRGRAVSGRLKAGGSITPCLLLPSYAAPAVAASSTAVGAERLILGAFGTKTLK